MLLHTNLLNLMTDSLLTHSDALSLESDYYMYPLWIISCEYLHTHVALMSFAGEEEIVFSYFTSVDVGDRQE